MKSMSIFLLTSGDFGWSPFGDCTLRRVSMLTTVFSLPVEDKNVFKIMAFYQFESKMSDLQLWSRKESFIFFVITKLIHH